MNILFFTNHQVSPFTGGIERVTSLIVQKLGDNGYKCFSVYLNKAKQGFPLSQFHIDKQISKNSRYFKIELSNFIENNGIDFIINQDSAYYCKYIKEVIDENNYKTKSIFFHHVSPGAEIINLNLRYYFSYFKRQNRPIINILRLVLFPFRKVWEPYKYRKIYRNIYRYNDRIVLLSKNYIKEWCDFASIKDCGKLTAINNCLTYSYFFDPTNYSNKRKEVLIVSRLLEGHKDISKALRIWKAIEMDSSLTDWSLKIVGYGPDEEYYKKLAVQLCLRTVFFEGVQDPQRYYDRSSIFMITSSYEGWVLTLNEAKQNGVVPIVYDSFSALKEMIKDGHDGYIIPFNDEHAYIALLKRLMSHYELRKTMAINAINKSKDYSADIIVKKWIKLFKDLSL